jgi:hypothetical protein
MRDGLLAAALACCVGCGGVNQTKLEPVYRAAKAIEAGTRGGTTYANFLILTQQFGTEVAIAHDKASTGAERVVVDRYETAVPIYRDSAALWALKLEHGTFLSDYGPATTVADKLNLPREGGTIDAEAGLQATWARAAVWVTAGNAAYTGR